MYSQRYILKWITEHRGATVAVRLIHPQCREIFVKKLSRPTAFPLCYSTVKMSASMNMNQDLALKSCKVQWTFLVKVMKDLWTRMYTYSHIKTRTDRRSHTHTHSRAHLWQGKVNTLCDDLCTVLCQRSDDDQPCRHVTKYNRNVLFMLKGRGRAAS